MQVDAIRKVRPNPDDPVVRSLDVSWERAMTKGSGGEQTPDDRPGAHGHCGIEGLGQDGTTADGANLRKYRKSLKRKLADLANEHKDTGPWAN